MAYLDVFRPGSLERVRAAMPEASRAIVEESPRTSWVPIEHDRHLPRAIVEVLGEEAATEMWRAFVGSHVQSPLLRSLLDGATRLLGFSPGTLVWMVPKAWGQVYRDFCTPKVTERDDHHATLAFEDMAPEVLAEPAYLICFRAVILGFFDIAGVEGELDWDVDPIARRAVARLRW
jgi:hypothetical protein